MQQLSKPVKNYLKQRAANNQYFRERVCIPMGMVYNNYFQRTVQEVTGSSRIPAISPEQAVQLGVEIYGEFLVFLGGGVAALSQYIRTQKKRQVKEDAQAAELLTTKGTVANMEKELDAHERNQDRKIADLHEEIQELKRLVAQMKDRST